MDSNLGVRCCLAVFLFCAVGFQSSTVVAARPSGRTVEVKPFGSGWTVIQQRSSGNQDFNRWWIQYQAGFGIAMDGFDFWAGLQSIHELTNGGNYELLIELKDKKGEYRYARYSEFVVGSEDEKYKLKLDGYSGTAGDINKLDAKDVPTGRPFSTRDDGQSCGGGWWWNSCGSSINSEWGTDAKWTAWKDEPLAYSRMLIRARE